MHLIGRPGSRYTTEAYPTRSNAFTSMTRFTPTFQTSNGDASIGADGNASASFWKTGNVLNVQGVFGFSGAGLSAGTGLLQLPLPPGITLSNIDVERMPNQEDVPGPPHIIEGIVPVHVTALIGVTTQDFPSYFLLAKNFTDVPPSVIAGGWTLDTTGLTANNFIIFDYAIPIL